MKRIALLLSPLLLAGAWETVQRVRQDPATGSLRIEPASIDLGRRRLGERVTVNCRVTNTGPETVELELPDATCAWTGTVLGASFLQPGDETTLAFTLQVQQLGQEQRAIPIRARQFELPVAHVTVRAEGAPTAYFVPALSYIDRLFEDSPPTPVELMLATPGCDVACEEVQTDCPPGWTVRHHCDSLERGAHRLHVDVACLPARTFGAYEGEIRCRMVACGDLQARAVVLYECVPRELQQAWPSCRLRLPEDMAHTAQVELPGVRLLSPVRAHGAACEFVRVQSAASESGTTITATVDADGPSGSELEECDVDVATSIGTVRIHVTKPSSAQPH